MWRTVIMLSNILFQILFKSVSVKVRVAQCKEGIVDITRVSTLSVGVFDAINKNEYVSLCRPMIKDSQVKISLKTGYVGVLIKE